MTVVPATTVKDIVVAALIDCGAFGVGMAPPATAINAALQRLNWMISQWKRKRWLTYRLVDTGFVSTGALTYTVGLGGQFNIPRPNQIDFAYMLQTVTSPNLPVRYPLQVIKAREDWSRIRLPTLVSWPNSAFYDPTLPLGTLYSWPVMQAGFEFHILTKQDLQLYAINDLVGLPEEYEAALYYNLVVRMEAKYRIAHDPANTALAKEGLNVLRGANNAIGTLRMPAGLRRTGARYNVYSDNN